jgi:hypothetical protein
LRSGEAKEKAEGEPEADANDATAEEKPEPEVDNVRLRFRLFPSGLVTRQCAGTPGGCAARPRRRRDARCTHAARAGAAASRPLLHSVLLFFCCTCARTRAHARLV